MATTPTPATPTPAPATPAPVWLADALAFQARLAELDCTPSTIMMEIDGLFYHSTKWTATDGLILIPRLAALLGDELLKALATKKLAEFDFVVGAIRIAENVDRLDSLVKRVLSRVQVNERAGMAVGGAVIEAFDLHFAGEYQHLLRVCCFAIGHNLTGFTRGSRSIGGSPSQADRQESTKG